MLLLPAALSLTGCTTNVLLVQDDRLAITTPADRATVQLPFTLEWRSDNPSAASYMVFVDRPPMPPGKTLAHFDVTDSLNGVYPGRDAAPLTVTSLSIDSLPPRGDLPPDEENRYEVTVIWLDENGRRLSENADYLTLEVEVP